jgi:hypothetical protein
MAVYAADLGVLSQQRKGQSIVVKSVAGEDIDAIMAGAAFSAKLTCMDTCESLVKASVAGLALRRIKAAQVFGVAVCAGKWTVISRVLMGSQAEAEQLMINLQGSNLRQVPLWAAVFGMAIAAAGRFEYTVQAARVVQICLDFRMAVHAQVIHA